LDKNLEISENLIGLLKLKKIVAVF